MKQLRGLSLFANIGIGEYYLSSGKAKMVLANELSHERAALYRNLHPHSEMIVGDISCEKTYINIIERAKELGVNFILATPPCQSMSILGQVGRGRRFAETDDNRSYLITHAVNAIMDIEPDYCIIENVQQMADTSLFINGKCVSMYDYIVSRLCYSYNVTFNKLDAADYGTPQHRRRLFILISKKPNIWILPDKILPYQTVRQAIGHLPSLETNMSSGLPWHHIKSLNERHVEWMKNTPTGASAFYNENPDFRPTVFDKKLNKLRPIKAFDTAYKRMWWDRPATTITRSNGGCNNQCSVHPGRPYGDTWSDARPLSVREIIILTGLPEDWIDHLSPDEISEEFLRDVIGECVAPKLVKILVDNIGATDTLMELFMAAA